jgi:hypothetical protein
MCHTKRVIVWLLRVLSDLLSPLVEQLGIFTEDSLGNSRIKIIIHALPSYEQGVTVINKRLMTCVTIYCRKMGSGPEVHDEPASKQEHRDELELTTAWEAFVGCFTSSDPHLAERSEEILRAELGG